MKKTPLISIVVPVYKVEAYLEDCINSILAQTCRNFELILVDDGSPDRSPAICDAYMQRYPFVKVVHKTNGGISSARNAGIEAAKGEYITFVDSDDIVSCDMLKTLMEGMQREEKADVVLTTKLTKFSDGTDASFPPLEGCAYTLSDGMEATDQMLFSHGRWEACGHLFALRLFSNIRFPETIRYAEDYEAVTKLLLQAATVVTTDASVYGYRVRENSAMASSARGMSTDLAIATEHIIQEIVLRTNSKHKRRRLIAGALLELASRLEYTYRLGTEEKSAEFVEKAKCILLRYRKTIMLASVPIKRKAYLLLAPYDGFLHRLAKRK